MGKPMKIRAASKDGVTEVKVLMSHEMETGLRKGPDGLPIPRDMLASFVAQANGESFVRVDFRNASSAHPHLVFFAKISGPTDFNFIWTHEDGRTLSAAARVEVT